MAVYAETLELRCACRDVHNPAGAASWHGGDPASFEETERRFRVSHQGEQCSVTVTRRSPQRQGRLL